VSGVRDKLLVEVPVCHAVFFCAVDYLRAQGVQCAAQSRLAQFVEDPSILFTDVVGIHSN
jgi:hypothetical protein